MNELLKTLEQLEETIDAWGGQGYALANPDFVALLLIATIIESEGE